MLDGLNPFAARFAHALFARHPMWRELAHVADEQAPVPGVLTLTVPCPAGGCRPLEIEADDQEVTLFYDRWHSHYDDWGEDDQGEPFELALDTIDHLLREEVVVAVDWEDGQWAGSVLAAPIELSALAPGRTRYIRSWAGTLDAGAPAT